jgi:hypothetical protein
VPRRYVVVGTRVLVYPLRRGHMDEHSRRVPRNKLHSLPRRFRVFELGFNHRVRRRHLQCLGSERVHAVRGGLVVERRRRDVECSVHHVPRGVNMCIRRGRTNRVPRGDVVWHAGSLVELAVHAVCGWHVESGGRNKER